MRKLLFAALLLLNFYAQAQKMNLSSPHNKMFLSVSLEQGQLTYALKHQQHHVLLPSSLAIVLKDPAVELRQFELVKADSFLYDETWKPVWGEYASIRDHHRKLVL